MNKQTGFTLIELAIVLVIIGLLLGGVLRGQELINSARVKNMTRDFQNIQVYLYGYQDRFKAVPGDDANVVTHLTGGTLATTGGPTNNGQIGGLWDSQTPTDESYLFWQHVRLAGLAPGSTIVGAAEYEPRNAAGGRIGVTSIANLTSITGMQGSYAVCSDLVLGRDALQLDTTLDDGNTATGNVRVVLTGTATAGLATAAVTANQAGQHIVCMSL